MIKYETKLYRVKTASWWCFFVFLHQDSGLHRDQSSPPRSVSSGPTEAWKRGSRREIHRDEHDAYVQQERIPEGEEGNNYHLSEAVSNYFQCSNGGLTPKENPNAIIIHSRRQIIWWRTVTHSERASCCSQTCMTFAKCSYSTKSCISRYIMIW